MKILHTTTGIRNQVGDPKKVRKIVPPLPPKKGEIGGLTFFSFFFPIVVYTGNTQMIAAWYKTYIGRFDEETEKKVSRNIPPPGLINPNPYSRS